MTLKEALEFKAINAGYTLIDPNGNYVGIKDSVLVYEDTISKYLHRRYVPYIDDLTSDAWEYKKLLAK